MAQRRNTANNAKQTQNERANRRNASDGANNCRPNERKRQCSEKATGRLYVRRRHHHGRHGNIRCVINRECASRASVRDAANSSVQQTQTYRRSNKQRCGKRCARQNNARKRKKRAGAVKRPRRVVATPVTPPGERPVSHANIMRVFSRQRKRVTRKTSKARNVPRKHGGTGSGGKRKTC